MNFYVDIFYFLFIMYSCFFILCFYHDFSTKGNKIGTYSSLILAVHFFFPFGYLYMLDESNSLLSFFFMLIFWLFYIILAINAFIERLYDDWFVSILFSIGGMLQPILDFSYALRRVACINPPRVNVVDYSFVFNFNTLLLLLLFVIFLFFLISMVFFFFFIVLLYFFDNQLYSEISKYIIPFVNKYIYVRFDWDDIKFEEISPFRIILAITYTLSLSFFLFFFSICFFFL